MKNFNIKTNDQTLIEVFENREDYYIPGFQEFPFTGYRQLTEACIKYMLKNNLLLKRERTEQ